MATCDGQPQGEQSSKVTAAGRSPLRFLGGCIIGSLATFGALALFAVFAEVQDGSGTPAAHDQSASQEPSSSASMTQYQEWYAAMRTVAASMSGNRASQDWGQWRYPEQLKVRMRACSDVIQRSSRHAAAAKECLHILEDLLALQGVKPDDVGMIREGEAMIRSGRNDDGIGFLFGLGKLGAEVGTHEEFNARMVAVHDRVIASRVSLVSELQSVSSLPAVRSASFINAEFGEFSPDALSLRNISGGPLTEVVVILTITNHSGEEVSNVFTADRWNNGDSLHAVCGSDRSWRETVYDVAKVQFAVVTGQGRMGPLDIRLR